MYICAAILAAMVAVCSAIGLYKVGNWVCTKVDSVALTVLLLVVVIATSEAQKRGGDGLSRGGAEARSLVATESRSFGEATLLSLLYDRYTRKIWRVQA